MKRNFFLSLAVAFICTAFITSCKDDKIVDNEVKVGSVSVTPTTLSLLIGTTGNITATVSPDNATNKLVKWSSDRPAVVSVSADGLVTALEVGTANITATSDADASKKATVAVEVTPVIISVDSITTSVAVIAVELGHEKTLTATVFPENATNPAFTWSSSAPTVVTVNATTGVINGVAEGTATITVTSTADPTKTATVSVMVVGIYVAEIKARPDAIPYFYLGTTKKVSIEILPAEAEPKDVVWASSNENVVTVNDEGLLTAVAVGTAEITVSWTLDAEIYTVIPVQVREVTKQTLLDETLLLYYFNDPANLAKSAKTGGTPLEFWDMTVAGNNTRNGLGELAAAPPATVAGPAANSGGVHLERNDYIKMLHPLTEVCREYTLMLDVRIYSPYSGYLPLFHRNLIGEGDATWFIRGSRGLGQSSYSAFVVPEDTWVRIFFSIRPLQEGDPGYEDRKDTHTARVIYMNSSENRFYNDASGSVQYGNIQLNPGHFFIGLDNDNEDNIFDVAGIALWTRALNEIDVDLLGPGFPETAR